MTLIFKFKFGAYDGGPDRKVFKYFSINAKEASRSGLLNSYGTHHPSGPNFFLSITIECKKQIVYNNVLQFGCSTFSKNS